MDGSDQTAQCMDGSDQTAQCMDGSDQTAQCMDGSDQTAQWKKRIFVTSKISMILKQFFIKYLQNRDTSVSQNQVP
jgi:hypothetical protein